LIGRDLTGSGKTFAFALPIVEYLRKNKLFKEGGVQSIIMAPTRELAL
jgi:ATP-dependent RNA helicase DeaD